MKLLAYTRVSTEQQGASGLGIDAQKESIRKAAEYHGHEIVWGFDDVISSREKNRPAWDRAVHHLTVLAGEAGKAGEAEGVIVAKLDRISRSVMEGAEIFAKFKKRGFTIVALDLGVDTSTAAGKLVATVMMAVAEWERDVISQRTTEALAVKRANGHKLGRPYPIDPASEERIRVLSQLSVVQIRDHLNANIGIFPPPGGGSKWHYATVQRHVLRLREEQAKRDDIWESGAYA